MTSDLDKYISEHYCKRIEISYQEYRQQIMSLEKLYINQIYISPTNALVFTLAQNRSQNPSSYEPTTLTLPTWEFWDYRKSDQNPEMVSYFRYGKTGYEVIQRTHRFLARQEMEYFYYISLAKHQPNKKLERENLYYQLFFLDGSMVSCDPGYNRWMVLQKGDGTSYEYADGKFYLLRKKHQIQQVGRVSYQLPDRRFTA